MSHTEPLRKGMVIRHEKHLYTVTDYHVAQTGKQKPTVHVKLRSLKDGKQAERTLDQLGTIDEVASQMREMQYLYASGTEYVFMDLETYEQYPLDQSLLEHASGYLLEDQTYRFLSLEGRPVSLQLPATVTMEITDTAPPEHAGGGGNVYKEATVASGRVVMVPLFIKKGDKIRINTDDGAYQGKEH